MGYQDCVPEIDTTIEDEDKDDDDKVDEEGEECKFFTAFEDLNNRNGWECKDGTKCINGFDHNGEACDTLCASSGFNIYYQECVPEIDTPVEDEDKDDDNKVDEEEECKFFTAFEDVNNRNGWECKDGTKCINGFNRDGQPCNTLCASTGLNIYGQECS